MDVLIEYSNTLLVNTPLKTQRFLFNQMDWDERMIAIKGSRGTGKTTLMVTFYWK